MMSRQLQPVPKLVSLGVCLSLLSVLFGFSIGSLFGIVESQIKSYLDDSGTAVLESTYQGDVEKKDAVVKKSFDYLKRAHLHGGGIGAASLASIAIMILLCRLGRIAQISAVSFGAGALIYSFGWLCAGLLAPGLGSTDAAKAAVELIAAPGAGLCLLGATGTLVSVARDLFLPSP